MVTQVYALSDKQVYPIEASQFPAFLTSHFVVVGSMQPLLLLLTMHPVKNKPQSLVVPVVAGAKAQVLS